MSINRLLKNLCRRLAGGAKIDRAKKTEIVWDARRRQPQRESVHHGAARGVRASESPLRPIRTWVNDALADNNAKLSATYEAESWWRITPSVLASRARCVARIADLERRAVQLSGKLDAQDAGAAYRGGKFSDSRAGVCFYHEIPPRQNNSCRPDRNR